MEVRGCGHSALLVPCFGPSPIFFHTLFTQLCLPTQSFPLCSTSTSMSSPQPISHFPNLLAFSPSSYSFLHPMALPLSSWWTSFLSLYLPLLTASSSPSISIMLFPFVSSRLACYLPALKTPPFPQPSPISFYRALTSCSRQWPSPVVIIIPLCGAGQQKSSSPM